jgi:type III restriction enzyme
MELKQYQRAALERVREYLQKLDHWRGQAKKHPDLVDPDFPRRAWRDLQPPASPDFRPTQSGTGEFFPWFCLKVPTGGGKTLLAVKSIDLTQQIYIGRQTGLVLWIVPTQQIYRQTYDALKDRNHPYRQHLDIASGGRTLILEKDRKFSPLDVSENLCVLMLMLQSANRQGKEFLKMFQDSGYEDFFPPEDNLRAHADLLARCPNLDTFGKESGFFEKQVKTSLGNVIRILKPLVILDEGHKAKQELAQETLKGFNPSIVIELTATPKLTNILVNIPGRDLLHEEMIKLDLHISNIPSQNWKDAMLEGFNKRALLHKKARAWEAKGGANIRPICLIQVERTGNDQREKGFLHAEDVREHLIKTLGVPEAAVKIKTSQKDELREVDDAGGLLQRDCPVEFIITKQALQEGWDCSFAYVLVILANPSSKTALTQLVGRILRQPYARKTGIPELDESYVYCYRRRAKDLLAEVQNGFDNEGLGDLKARVHSLDLGQEEAGDEPELFPIQAKFREAAKHTFLPVFVVKEGKDWRPVNYEMDILSRIPWDEANTSSLEKLSLNLHEERGEELVVGIEERTGAAIEHGRKVLAVGGIHLDPFLMARELRDSIVSNPWQAYLFSKKALDSMIKVHGEKKVEANFSFIIRETRNVLEEEKERLSRIIFHDLLERDEMRFLVISKDFNFSFNPKIAIRHGEKRLVRPDNTAIQMNLYEAVPEDFFNDSEKEVAWCLEDQERLFFWFRNPSKTGYGIQGWRDHKVYPDFIFTTKDKKNKTQYERLYVVETKGEHLAGNEKTGYLKDLFKLCTEKAKKSTVTELGLRMRGKEIEFEVVSEKEWEKRLNELLVN